MQGTWVPETERLSLTLNMGHDDDWGHTLAGLAAAASTTREACPPQAAQKLVSQKGTLPHSAWAAPNHGTGGAHSSPSDDRDPRNTIPGASSDFCQENDVAMPKIA